MNAPAAPLVIERDEPALESGLHFDNSFERLGSDFYTKLAATPLAEPYHVATSPAAAALLGLDMNALKERDWVEALSGNRAIAGTEPLAAVYSGHQFGVYVPQLGDGRALLLGEAVASDGTRWEIQLKGAGRTPYSRMGDGRAVLRSSVREFLASEALHALGIPTTRALAVVGADFPVFRETTETAAIVTRLAPSFIRFGNFEFFHWTRQHESLVRLADYVIDRYYPECREHAEPVLTMLALVARRTARLVAQWQGVGFCHGVLNTDNMSILGLTIDYGPYGFLDAFDAGYICNHSDEHGRYAYNQQPQIAHWNLYALAEALLPLTRDVEATRAAVDVFVPEYTSAINRVFRSKLGFASEFDEDTALLMRLIDRLQADRVDWTIFWRRLSAFDTGATATNSAVRDLFIDRGAFDAWGADYRARLEREHSVDADRAVRMNAVNPKYILRNHLAEIAIRLARGDDGPRNFSGVEQLMKVLASPYDEQPENEAFAGFPPDWATTLELSCSS